MDAYIFQAALYCETCGEKIRAKLTKQGKAPADPDNEHTYDSDDFPKGPYSDGGGEADVPENCDACHLFLENPLTMDGYEYVRGMAQEEMETEGKLQPVVKEWLEFYGINSENPS